MIRDTACEKCPYKSHDKCPNYIETLWHEEGNPQPVVVKDCAPKRSLLLSQELYNRTFALQQQINQCENQILKLQESFSQLLTSFSMLDKKISSSPLIPYEKVE